MKVEVTMFGQAADKHAAPPQMSRQSEELLRSIAWLMRTYGIIRLSLDVVPAGAVPLLNPKYDTFDDALVPEELKKRRHTLIRTALMGLMALYGFNTISIMLSPEEQQEVQAYWKYLDSGDTQALDKVQFRDVPLRIDRDPVAEPPNQLETLK